MVSLEDTGNVRCSEKDIDVDVRCLLHELEENIPRVARNRLHFSRSKQPCGSYTESTEKVVVDTPRAWRRETRLVSLLSRLELSIRACASMEKQQGRGSTSLARGQGALLPHVLPQLLNRMCLVWFTMF